MSGIQARIAKEKILPNVKLETSLATSATSDTTDRRSLIKQKKLIAAAYPFEEHGL